MWLLHSTLLKLEAYSDANVPKYAILSHRWGDSEVSFQELQAVLEGRTDELLLGELVGVRFSKIQKTRALASKDGIDWIWIDTCCIDKKSSAELSEAINSMYQWYERAEVCYVYMADVTRDILEIRRDIHTHPTSQNGVGSFQGSAWFARGWTLQELLAPTRVGFYNHEWAYVGNRKSLGPQISWRTGIEPHFLEDGRNLDSASIAKKMSWAADRQTTRLEDTAYCLLGLFGVNMPLLYGEGAKAFMRLQLEIIRKSDDESIFAWRRKGPKTPWELSQAATFYSSESMRRKREWWKEEAPSASQRFELHSGLLAQEPRDFSLSGPVEWKRDMKFARRLPYDMTNQGLRFYVDAYPSELQRLTHVRDSFVAVLNCYTNERMQDKPVVITLMKEIAGYDQYWRRRNCMEFEGSFKGGIALKEEKVQTAFFIRQDGL